MKVFAIGTFSKPPTPEQRAEFMPKEVPNTLQLYLDGKIEQFWFRQDKPGTVFLMDVASVDEAKSLIGKLPLTDAGLLMYEFMPVGPLAPLGSLIPSK
ncbi:MAG TPA: hypothetical protein VGM74_02850 [Burkholderiaceae bacterium]|jgi:hypothetical protein